MKTKLALLGAVPLLFSMVHAVVSAPSYHLINRISLPGDASWDYMTMDSQNSRLYVARGSHVTAIDTRSGKVAGDIPDTYGVHGIALDPKLDRGFTSDGRANQVAIFDMKTLKTIGTVPVGNGPDCIIFDPASGRVFTFNGEASTATAIDAKTGTVVGTVALPGRPEFAVADGQGHVYDNITDKSEVVAINSKTLAIDHTWPLAPGTNPSGIAMDTQHRRLFSVCRNQQMVVLNADTGHVVATPPIGSGPDACRFDPKTNLVFSPNGGDGYMTILREIGPNNYRTVQTLPTQDGARTMALDTKTGDIFTVTATALPAAPGTPHWRRQYVPGSFVVLEYGP